MCGGIGYRERVEIKGIELVEQTEKEREVVRAAEGQSKNTDKLSITVICYCVFVKQAADCIRWFVYYSELMYWLTILI